jgi:hypothetical protein
MAQTPVIGSNADAAPKDYLVESSFDNITGVSKVIMVGVQDDLDTADGMITIWDNKFDYTPFTGDTEMFINSTDAGDTQTIRVQGLDTNFEPVAVEAALSGQTQVSVGIFRHVQLAAVNDATTPAGSVYIAASDTLTAGVPDTNSKVKSKIIQGKNITHNGFYMTPAGKTGGTLAIRASTDADNKPATIQTWVYPFGLAPRRIVTYSATVNFPQFTFPAPTTSFDLTADSSGGIRGEKSLVLYKAQAAANNTAVFFGVDILLVDQSLTSQA